MPPLRRVVEVDLRAGEEMRARRLFMAVMRRPFHEMSKVLFVRYRRQWYSRLLAFGRARTR